MAHQFKVNYSKIKDISIGQCVTSPTFKSGGYQWAIYFYPKGCFKEGNKGCYASLFLKLLDDHKGLDVSFTLGIVQDGEVHGTGLIFRRSSQTFRNSHNGWGLHELIKRTDLEEQYATNGFFVVLCTINMKDTISDDALEDISKLLKCGEMTDVKFEVEGEIFAAHRLILGARSPVFKAELFGSMCEKRMECVKIRDMKSEVFKALLHFVYTYSLPDDADTDFIQHLIVAADRYAIKGLISIC